MAFCQTTLHLQDASLGRFKEENKSKNLLAFHSLNHFVCIIIFSIKINIIQGTELFRASLNTATGSYIIYRYRPLKLKTRAFSPGQIINYIFFKLATFTFWIHSRVKVSLIFVFFSSASIIGKACCAGIILPIICSRIGNVYETSPV